ncbi:MAG TPA: MFS transporter [Gemmatimonadaceae bacterium]|nr:MFS transporter [Gemmatimonadaceae bacterium]
MPDHPGYVEGILVTGSRVFASGAMFAGLVLALGGGHYAIAAVAAIPYLARLPQLLVPMLVRRRPSATVAQAAAWLERLGLLLAAAAGILRPDGWAVPGFLAGLAVAMLGQSVYDGTMAALHSEASTPETFGHYNAAKSRWASMAGLVLGVLASLAVDATERVGVPAHVARALAIATGVAMHLFVYFALERMRGVAKEHLAARRARGRQTVPTPAFVLPVPGERWALVRFALAWGFATGISLRQGEAMAISILGVSVGAITLLNALLVGAGLLGAKTWGRLADRFGGKGLLSIALVALALDPLWVIAAMLVHPLLLVPSYFLWGVFNSGWNIAQNMTLVRTRGHPADRIRSLTVYNVTFGIAAGVAPLVGGAILELVDAHFSARVSYGTLFMIAAILRLSAYPLLRKMPAPPAERGRYVGAVVVRAVRRAVRRRAAGRTRAIGRIGASLGSSLLRRERKSKLAA